MTPGPIDLFDPSAAGWNRELPGNEHGSDLSLILIRVDETGFGPDSHTHPYEEVFIIRQGHARFTVGSEEIDVHAGQVVIAPAGIPHGFKNLGPGTLETIDIHASGTFDTTYLG